jgi:hypothetical protein
MAKMKFANNANTTLASSLTAIATSMSVTSASSFPVLVGTDYFYCTLTDVATNLVIEIVKVTVTTGTTWTITRGQDGTTGTAFAAGDTVSLRLVRASLDDFPKLDEANTFTGVLTASGGVVGNLTGNADTVTTNANLTGAITSVGNATTMNSALDSLTDVVIATPVVDQILKYNGAEWVNGAASSISAGYGIEYYNATPQITASGTNSALAIFTLSATPITTAEQTTTTTTINGTVAGTAWLSTALGRTTLDAGTWDFTVFASVSSIGGVQTTVKRQMYAALPFVTGTVTTTGTGTSRTATASAGTPFATTEIVASATNTLASYLQTPQGLYQITARTSDTVVTISTLTTYVNESAVAGTVWKLLFAGGASPNLTTSITQYDIISVQPAFTISVLTKLGAITFATSTGVRTVTTTYNGTLRNTHIASPLAVLHNQLGGLQGGAADQQYHLTDAEYTGSGTGVFARVASPTLVTPVLGVATATSINKMAITAPATSSTLAVADGKTLTASNSLTLAGTDSTTQTFPTTSATIARTDAAQTFTGTQRISAGYLGFSTANDDSLIYKPNDTTTGTGSLTLQAGAGSAGFGGGYTLYGNAHATYPGWTMAGISAGSGGKFAVNTTGTGGGTNVFTVDDSGNVVANATIKGATTISVGAATPSASGAGITFPATQSASTDANTLDDYEEGTWTPAQGSGLTVVGTFSSAGNYTKIGRQVTINFLLSASTSLAATAGAIIVNNLPFTASSPNDAFACGSGTNNINTINAGVVVVTNDAYSNGVFSAATNMFFTLTYIVA